MSDKSREQLFRERVDQYIAKSTGLSRLVYKVLGPRVTGSLALVLEPSSKFKVSKEIVTKANRTRSKGYRGIGQAVFTKRTKRGTSVNCPVGKPESVATNEQVAGPYMVGTLAVSRDVNHDTTARTRPLDSTQGEMSYSKFRMISAGRIHHWLDSHNTVDYATGTYSWSKDTMSVEVYPYSGFLTTAALTSLRASEEQNLLETMGSNATKLLKGSLPAKREMSIFRSIVELRDLPRTIKGTLDTMYDAVSAVSDPKKLSQAYLTKEFGWDPLISDVKDLLRMTETLPRRLAYLQSRHLKDTTFHSSMRILQDGGSTAFSIPYVPPQETVLRDGVRNVREVRLRGTLNCFFRFPDIDKGLPTGSSYSNLLGLNPTAYDIYNLIPWTWLVDWFTGLGDYLEALIEFNSDPNTVNYGFLSGKSVLDLHTVRMLRSSSRSVKSVDGKIVSNTTSYHEHAATCSGQLTTYIRKDAAEAYSLPCTSTLKGLSEWQSTILGALAASRYLK